MAARWLLLALLAAHAAALPDIIRIGEYLSSLYLLELKGSLSLSLSLTFSLFTLLPCLLLLPFQLCTILYPRLTFLTFHSEK